MKAIHWMLTVSAIASGLPAPAQAAVTDPEVIIYRFPGVRDDGFGDFVGVATVFHCTNFSGATENIRFVSRDSNAGLVSNVLISINHLATLTVATHLANAYAENSSLATGLLIQGTTAIAATSINVICTAMTIDAASFKPVGVALRGIRFNPIPGSQE